MIGFKRGETDYRISLIPLGGYCRFFGEEAFREAIEKDLPAINATKGEFYGATPFRRIAVAVSGPLVNVIFAILVFTIIFWIGFAEPYKEPRIMLSTEILGEPPTMPANKAGLESGDLILAADKTEISSYYELSEYVSLRPNKEIELLVDRNGRQLTLEIIPELNKEFGKAQIGVFPLERPLVVDVIPGSAADKAGLISDDLIVSANGSAIVAGIQLEIAFGNASGGVVELGIERKGMTETVMYDTSLIVNNTGIILPKIVESMEDSGFARSISRGFSETFGMFTRTIRGLRMLFMGIKVRNAVSGPARLVNDVGTNIWIAFSYGFGTGMYYTFRMLASISVALAFMNLLPIPVMDGGQILLFGTEWIIGKPVRPGSIYRYQFVGTIIVLILFVAASYGDGMHLSGR